MVHRLFGSIFLKRIVTTDDLCRKFVPPFLKPLADNIPKTDALTRLRYTSSDPPPRSIWIHPIDEHSNQTRPFWHRDARTNPSNLQWGDPLKQQARMARLIVGLKKRRVWKDVSRNRPCKQLHSFLIYEPTLWKKSVFRLKVWLLGMDKQDLLVRGKPEMLAKKAKQASTGRTKCTYKLIDMIPLPLSLASWLVAQ